MHQYKVEGQIKIGVSRILVANRLEKIKIYVVGKSLVNKMPQLIFLLQNVKVLGNSLVKMLSEVSHAGHWPMNGGIIAVCHVIKGRGKFSSVPRWGWMGR